jgi:hypothetical protein
MSTLSPFQLIAGSALAANAGIGVSSSLTDSINAYNSTELIPPWKQTLSNPQLALIASGLIPTLITLTASSCPALSDSTPAAFASQVGIALTGNASSGNSINGFTSLIPEFGSQDLGSGDNTKFVQAFIAAQSYIATANQYIQATNSGNEYLGSSFTSMNDLITGNLSEINLEFTAFGNDLKSLGQAIALDNLDNLGSPLALLQQLSTVAGLTPKLALEFDTLNINPDVVFNPPESLASLLLLQKLLYRIFLEITGDDLNQVLQLLEVTTVGIDTMADLLNPVKIFPSSFDTLTVKTINGIEKIYLSRQGSVNTNLLQLLPENIVASYTELATAVPADQALANQALRTGLQQIKNIFNLTLSELADSYLGITSVADLPLINSLTQPLPESVIDFYRQEFSTGTGPNGTFVIDDFFGAASGSGYVNRIDRTVETFQSLRLNPGFVNLTTTYTRMNNTLNGVYGNPIVGPVNIPAGPGAGRYNAIYSIPVDPEEPPELIETAGSVALRTGLIPAATQSVTQITNSASAAVDQLNQDWNQMAEKLIEERNNQETASIDLDDLIPNEETAILSFVQNLPSYGEDTSFGGAADFLEDIADKNTLGGQAIVACLRQGRNVQTLDRTGISTDVYITPAQS